MKNFIIIFAALYNFLIQADPLLVAVLMVKDEESVMQTTLQPLVDAGITDFLIYDTGSTDRTIQVTREFFAKNDISNYVIKQGEWIDFATCRNQALDLTEQHFPDATFMLMLDAEWILHNGKDLLEFCLKYKYDTEPIYFIRLHGFAVDFYHPRLIRCKTEIRFEGKVHETPKVVPNIKIDEHVCFEYMPSDIGYQKTQNRWKRDKELLLQELQNNPNNPRILFFLGQTCAALGDMQDAIKYYKYRLTVPGDIEENFLVVCFLAQAYASVGNEDMMNYYALKAYDLRPTRAESLVFLAQYYYEHNQYYLCYLLARHACTIPYPTEDVLLVHHNVYKFLRYALVSATAYMVGDYDLGKKTTRKALQAHPELQFLHDNLKFYESA